MISLLLVIPEYVEVTVLWKLELGIRLICSIKMRKNALEYVDVIESVTREDLLTCANYTVIQLNTCGVDTDTSLTSEGLNTLVLPLDDNNRETSQYN